MSIACLTKLEDIEIRQCDKGDIASLVEIDSQNIGGGWNYQSFTDEYSFTRSKIYIAENTINREILGFIVFRLSVDEIEIFNIAVLPSVRRKGIGRKLMQVVIQFANIQKKLSILLEVRSSNEKAIALYKSLGFRTTGKRQGYYQKENEDALLMELRIK
ncbi:MAG: ribosomal protein S18-alanine N-acetyltransferase [Deltaproteobacteria bacterium]|nr:ribosomal protein S18-alanine N-acetyltransferase [Deltaproteobacteria bacterium]